MSGRLHAAKSKWKRICIILIDECGGRMVSIAFGLFVGLRHWSAGRKGVLPNPEVITAIFLLSLLVVSGIAAIAFCPVAQATDTEAPPFTLTSLDGATFNLSDYRGKVVVLDLMAIWCPVCHYEMRELSKLSEEYNDVVILSVFVDPEEPAEDLRNFKEAYNADWPFARDTDNVLVKYGAFTLPTIVVIDPQGRLSFQDSNFVPAEELKLEVESAYLRGVEEPEELEEPEEQEGAEESEETALTVTGLYLLALLTGLMSFFAPCAFPLLPGYMSYYIGGYGGGPTLRGSVKAGIASATGINAMFALVGAAVAVGGFAIHSYLMYLTPGVGIVIVLLGLSMVFGKTEFFAKFGGILSSYSAKLGGSTRYSGLFMYGAGYGLASMGCQAPVFIALIFAGLAAGGVLEAIMIFLSFSIGMGTMMLAVTVIVGTAKTKVLERLKELTPHINRACGVVLIIVGAYFLWGYI